MMKRNLAVLISGRGANLGAILSEAEKESFPGLVRCVISNNHEARGILVARDAGIPAFVVQKRDLGSLPECDRKIQAILAEHEIDLVCLAGFMRVLGQEIIANWRGKIINIHPSLLPSFPGLDVQAQALKETVKIAGCTVHFVDEGVDTGRPIVAQAAVPVKDNDTVETLSDRILDAELLCYPYAVMKLLGSPSEELKAKVSSAAERGVLLS